MKSRQLKRLISFLETGQVCRENISIISVVPGMLRQVQQFDNLILLVLERMYKQAEPISHFGQDKKAARKALVEHAVWLSSMASAYAHYIKSYEAGSGLGWSYTSLYRNWDTRVTAICTFIHKKLTAHQEKLKDYGIKKKDIVLLDELIKGFEKLYTAPRGGVVRRSVQTEALKKDIDATSKLLNEGLDKMIPCFRDYPEFCAAFKESRVQKKYDNPKLILEKRIKSFYLAPQVPVSRKRKKMAEESLEVVQVPASQDI
jgi:hypothetical protein